jgi:hypothetical protein
MPCRSLIQPLQNPTCQKRLASTFKQRIFPVIGAKLATFIALSAATAAANIKAVLETPSFSSVH